MMSPAWQHNPQEKGHMLWFCEKLNKQLFIFGSLRKWLGVWEQGGCSIFLGAGTGRVPLRSTIKRQCGFMLFELKFLSGGPEDLWSIRTFSTSLTMNLSAEMGIGGGTRMFCHQHQPESQACLGSSTLKGRDAVTRASYHIRRHTW